MINRLRGSLDGLTDSEQRPLRPIGSSVREIAARTGRLLDKLRPMPGVRVCACVRIAADHQPIGFAISAAAQVLLIESVAWPRGAYSTAPDGRVLCDGVYIGQSVRPLVGSVRRLRRALPRDHRVGAVVVVHPYGTGPIALPETAPAALTWLRPRDTVGHLGRRLCAAGRSPYSLDRYLAEAEPVTVCAAPPRPGNPAARWRYPDG